MQGSPTFSHIRLTHNKSADSCRSNTSTVSACLTACPSEVAVFCRFAAADEDLQLRSLVNVLQHLTSIMSDMNRSVPASEPHSMLCFDLNPIFFTLYLKRLQKRATRRHNTCDAQAYFVVIHPAFVVVGGRGQAWNRLPSMVSYAVMDNEGADKWLGHEGVMLSLVLAICKVHRTEHQKPDATTCLAGIYATTHPAGFYLGCLQGK